MKSRILYQKEIENRISTMPAGSVFSASDFYDIADTDPTNKALSRMAASGKIRRIIQGIYDKPMYSEFLHEYAAPDIDGVAKALAKKYNWTIAPCGDTALNRLHLSTQVPNVWTYISDGPYKNYSIGKTNLRLKKTANKEISGKSDITITLIQALKALGKNRIDDRVIKILRSELKEYDKEQLLEESRTANGWIRETIKEIVSQEGENV